MIFASTTVAFAGFAALARTMDRHRDDLGARTAAGAARRGWQAAGWALLGLSFLICLSRWNPSIATAVWLGAIGFAALGLGLVLTYRPRLANRLGPALLVAGLAAWALAR